jgi:hypothetical protein
MSIYEEISNDPVTGVIVNVQDYDTGEPVYDAEVSTKKKGGIETSRTVKRSGTDGMVSFYPLDPVEYDFEISLTGYVSVSGSIMIASGIMKEIRVRLRMA